jgi:hypothetical protein
MEPRSSKQNRNPYRKAYDVPRKQEQQESTGLRAAMWYLPDNTNLAAFAALSSIVDAVNLFERLVSKNRGLLFPLWSKIAFIDGMSS